MSAVTPFAERVVQWQKVHGRSHLPWQNTRDPYRIWLSEIMLQQTQVGTVLSYYERFLKTLPTVRDLASAEHATVMSLWAGLGYYSRARNLHACAKQVCERFGGTFPVAVALLESLPGIGRSTAGAIAAFAADVQAPILDGNVKRLFARHFAVAGDVNATSVQRELWGLAEQQLPVSDIVAYTQGLMDLGATICVRRRPHCLLCPVQHSCQAWRQGRVDELPAPRARLQRPTEYWRADLLFSLDGRIWLEPRPMQGIWGGLWVCPMQQAASLAALTEIGNDALPGTPAGPVLTHDLTHKRLLIKPYRRVWHKSCEPPGSTGRWFDWPLRADAPVPRPLQVWAQGAVGSPSEAVCSKAASDCRGQSGGQ
jgi:A/G-specific adenine glycosylase